MNISEEEWEKIIRDAGFQRIKARDYRRNFKDAFDRFQGKKTKKKPVIESKDIMEPLNPYKKNKKS
jgi:hypothetical protein